MIKEEIKLPDLSGLKSIGESFDKMNDRVFSVPKVENFVDPKLKGLFINTRILILHMV